MLQLSTFFYKVLQRSMRDTIFLHNSINSTLYLICRKCKMLIYKHFCVVETCRTCRKGETVFFRETFFIWALPFRSGYAGGSVLDNLPRCRLPMVICNVAVHLTQLRSLSIPNAETPATICLRTLVPARGCSAKRYNCTIHHGCTMFHCEVWSAVMAGGLSLLIGLSAARQTIIRYNCYILFALDFPGSRYLQSLTFPRLMRLFSHCKGKTRPLRTAALCKVTPSGFG